MDRPVIVDYLIIGGGLAGVTAAETVRARDREGSIVIISKENHPLYSRVMLPGYVRGKLEREKVFLRTLDHYAKLRIDLFLGEEVRRFDGDMHEVHTDRGRRVAFRKMLIATGGSVRPWNVPGSAGDRVLRLQVLEDADRARQVLERFRGQALVVGGGFISLEFIESAVAYGCEAHVFLREKQYFHNEIEDVGWEILRNNFERHHVVIHPETSVQLFEMENDMLLAHTSGGEKIRGAWVGVGIGLERNFNAFQVAGIAVEKGIRTNQYLETSLEHVWAAGDVAEYFDTIFDEHRLVGNWTNSFLQGKVAGTNMARPADEKPVEFRAVSSYSLTNLGFQITFVGKTSLGDQADSIVRAWKREAGYERLFFEGGILKGAILFNRFQDKSPLAKLIESKKDLSREGALLRDTNFNVASIL